MKEVSALLSQTRTALLRLEEVAEQGTLIEAGRKQAVFYRDVVMKVMTELRTPVDKLEMIVDKEMWPMPSYGDLIFEV